MKIKIILPTSLDHEGKPVKTRSRFGKFANLSFIYLAGLTPPEHEVEVIDDLFEDINFDDPVDLVALTAMTSQAPRAYQLAREFRRRGVKVVMGGIHASFLSEEAAGEVDAVVKGEAELIWPQVLADAEKGGLQKLYHGPAPETLSGLPVPRYDLLRGKHYDYNYYPVWASRGCPRNCKHCTVTRFYGGVIRHRPVAEVVRDIRRSGRKKIFFTDENLFVNRDYYLELIEAIKPLKVQWGGETDPRLADDEELLDLAGESGFDSVFIGFESLFERDLGRMDKVWARLNSYREVVKKLHRRGILVHASMIFGVNSESRQTARELLDRLEEWRVDELSLFLFTPPPGSRFYDELVEQGRDFSRNWSLYNGNHALIAPEGMTRPELEDLYWDLYQRFYQPRSALKRFARFPYRPRVWLMSLARNLLVLRLDVKNHRAVLSNFWDPGELLPRYLRK